MKVLIERHSSFIQGYIGEEKQGNHNFEQGGKLSGNLSQGIPRLKKRTRPVQYIQPFDAVILDANNAGMEVAKEILAVNPHQRIIFASAYVKDAPQGSIPS